MTESQDDTWKGISEELIEKSRAFYERSARRAWSHACSILIGCPQRPTEEARNGTGVLLRYGGEHFVVTACHIVTRYGELLREVDHLHFQIGDLSVNPFTRLAYADETNDIAVIAIAPHEVAAIEREAYVAPEGWPSPSPSVGQQIQFCGYARINRSNLPDGKIQSTVLPLIAEVHNSTPESFSVRFEREKYRWDGDCLLKPDQEFLGGMSGGPALLLDDPSFPLVGIVSQGNEKFDLVYFRPLSLVPWQELIAG